MSIEIKPAERRKRKLRMALDGISGSGKSLTALGILRGVLGPEGRLCAIDTEHESLSEYAGIFPTELQPSGFDHIVLTDFSVNSYMAAIDAVVKAGYDGLLIDQASHAWAGKGGILEYVDTQAGEDGFFSKKGWRKATPMHAQFIDKMIGAPLHLIATLRVKSEYVIEKDSAGKNTPHKVGLQPIQREGFDYEFSILGSMDKAHVLRINKSRCLDADAAGKLSNFLEGAVIPNPGIPLGVAIREWLNAPPGAWVPPMFSRTFVVNDKTIVSGGISRDTYVSCLNMGGKVDKKHGGGTSRALITSAFQAATASALTEDQGQALLAALSDRLEMPAEQKEGAK